MLHPARVHALEGRRLGQFVTDHEQHRSKAAEWDVREQCRCQQKNKATIHRTGALSLVALPVWILADERTITWVMGSPIKPLTVFQPLCEELTVGWRDALLGINLSVASTHSNVSKLATTAMVAAKIQMALSPMAENPGTSTRNPTPKDQCRWLWLVGTSTSCLSWLQTPLRVMRCTTIPTGLLSMNPTTPL